MSERLDATPRLLGAHRKRSPVGGAARARPPLGCRAPLRDLALAPGGSALTVRWWRDRRRVPEGRRKDAARDVRPRRLLGDRPYPRWLGGRALLQPAVNTLRAFEAFARAPDRDVPRRRSRRGARAAGAGRRVARARARSAIAGDHRGRDAVMAYFDRRRDARGRRAVDPPRRGRLVSDDVVVQLADGELKRDGERRRWRTAGVYRFEGEQVAEAWLVPLDLAAFSHLDRAVLTGGRLSGVRGPQQDQGHDDADGQDPCGGHPDRPAPGDDANTRPSWWGSSSRRSCHAGDVCTIAGERA